VKGEINMQEKEYNKLNFPNGMYTTYRGLPLYRDVIIKTKDNNIIIGELKHVSLYENGDILYLQTKKGKIDIDINNIDDIDLYIEQENDFKLDDIVEVINIDGLNTVLYDEYPKGFNKNLIGMQGKITMIDNVTTRGITYYLVDLPVNNNRIQGMRYLTDGRTVFLGDNLKLVKRGGKNMDNSRFFDFSNVKPLNYKDLDGKTLKMTLVDNN
jgi:small nuclear ribonucleoprotein (snRNP)-like protein